MLNFQTESWPDVVEEMKPLFARHWEEIGVDRDACPMDMDFEMYQKRFDEGSLHVLTARDEGELIGYYVSFVCKHMHYKSTVFGFSDIYYVVPEYRGLAGVRLLIEVEKAMRAMGFVKKLTAATKSAHSAGAIFESLGWREQERVYTKVIE